MLEKLLAKIEQVLSGYFVPKADLDAANAKLAELQAKLTSSTEAESSLSTAQASIDSLTQENATLKAEVEKLKADAVTVDALASRKATELCAAQGIIAANLTPAASDAVISAEQELANLRTEMQKEKDPIKRAHMAIRCRELRGQADIFSTPTKA